MGKFEDLTGKKFNRLTVLCLGERNSCNQLQWKCKCECGNIILATTTYLKTGHTKSCGCYNKEMSFLKNSIDMTDKIFGELTPIKATTKRRNGSVIWECQCSCGKTTFVT